MEISVANLSYAFGSKKIFENISFTMHSGYIHIIKGQSGSGKTTLLNILAGYLTDYSGTISVPSKVNIEYVFQDELLFENLTVRENLDIKRLALEESGLDNVSNDYREILDLTGIAECMEYPVNTMSGGEKQRLQIAKAILGNPDVILLDEPTSKLDAEYAASIARMINHCFRDKLTIVVTHDDIAKYFTNVKLFQVENRGLVKLNGE